MSEQPFQIFIVVITAVGTVVSGLILWAMVDGFKAILNLIVEIKLLRSEMNKVNEALLREVPRMKTGMAILFKKIEKLEGET